MQYSSTCLLFSLFRFFQNCMIFVFSHQLRTFFFFCSSSCTTLLFLLLDNTLVVVVSESDGDGLLFAASATDLALAFAVSLDMYHIPYLIISVHIRSVSEWTVITYDTVLMCHVVDEARRVITKTTVILPETCIVLFFLQPPEFLCGFTGVISCVLSPPPNPNCHQMLMDDDNDNDDLGDGCWAFLFPWCISILMQVW